MSSQALQTFKHAIQDSTDDLRKHIQFIRQVAASTDSFLAAEFAYKLDRSPQLDRSRVIL